MRNASWALCLVVASNCRTAPGTHATAGTEFPTLRKQNLILGNDTAAVEVAATDQSRAVGLMFRTVMAENEGMLFIFDSAGIYPFWMRNTELPLSIAFIDSGGIITDIQDMAPHDETSYHGPHKPVLYALEMNQGWYLRHRVSEGDSVQQLPAKP